MLWCEPYPVGLFHSLCVTSSRTLSFTLYLVAFDEICETERFQVLIVFADDGRVSKLCHNL